MIVLHFDFLFLEPLDDPVNGFVIGSVLTAARPPTAAPPVGGDAAGAFGDAEVQLPVLSCCCQTCQTAYRIVTGVSTAEMQRGAEGGLTRR
eukprot:SAG31_NODE_12717_length_922_cov_0.699878_1_plen_91_part_00